MTESEKTETAAHVEQTKAVSDIALARQRRTTRIEVWIVAAGMALLLAVSATALTVTLVHNYQTSGKAAAQRAETLSIAKELKTDLAESAARGVVTQQILAAIQQATDPNSAFSKASATAELAAINRAISCIENHADRDLAVAGHLPVPSIPASCPGAAP